MATPINDNTELSGMRNTIKRLSMQASRRAALPDRAIAESDLGDVKPWGVAGLVAAVLGIFAYSFVQALRDIAKPFRVAEDKAKLAKEYAKESKKLAKKSKDYAKQAKAEAKRQLEQEEQDERIAQRIADDTEARERRRLLLAMTPKDSD